MPVIRPGLRVRRSARGRSAFAPPSQIRDRLSDLPDFGANPGSLLARFYVPEGMKENAPLVVVLHGCTQNAAAYDHGAGWSRLADRHGFALLYPEQQRANNPMLCFNWFSDGDTRRGEGEPASIRAMIEAMRVRYGIDPARIFVTGLSAGGAMASVMLAAYPEVFAAGAIIAGVPYGCASDAAQAFECMAGRGRGGATRDLAARVRRASPHQGPWPRVQVWQGSADRTVAASNADAIVRQWTGLHGLPAAPQRSDLVAGHPRRQWLDASGALLVEQYEITGMAHGTPLDPGTDEGRSGEAGAHMLDVGLSSTDRIAAFFGIAPAVEPPARRRARPRVEPTRPRPAGDVQALIEDALRAAGLMR
ncbi:PHB depolymerase family esterase [Sphingomonas parva]|uniref:PHB depolymerase family esterase n=1 Tax=Sphingomonas parva TaxID=2555898 RepID=A0A4Y8ZWZ0_9SPHN|nr:PHB depolymerase family esterase [Sphingomonas parva]TFI59279.1 PHB depolymerase family esterase [Sphingomonas parva]